MKSNCINWENSTTKLQALQQRAVTASRNDLLLDRAILGAACSTAKRHMLRASAATLLIMTILVGTIWGAQDPVGSYVIEAMLWAGGFVFLGLAVDSSMTKFKWLLATGLALPILALLSSGQAIEFSIIAAVLVAVWAGYAIIAGWKLK